MGPLLVYPDPQKPYVLYTDASDTCIGAVLTQQGKDENEKDVEKPIYLLSPKLSSTQCRWPTTEKGNFCHTLFLARMRS